MIGAIFSIYRPAFVANVVYMLQSTEYQPGPYLRWFWRTQNFNTVAHRRKLDRTQAARLLLLAMSIGITLQILLGLFLIVRGAQHHLTGGVWFGLAVLVAYPVTWAHLIVLPLVAGRLFIVKPKESRLIQTADQLFHDHSAVKIAVAGSYGKTTMKELLLTVLAEGKRVAATPGNKNVPVSHARFAKTLKGNEQVLVIEYGEGRPGDIAEFARVTHPDLAIITGVAPAHLDQYKTLEAAGKDIFSLAEFVPAGSIYVNAESSAAEPFIRPDYHSYNQAGVLGWKVTDIKVTKDGTSFQMSKAKKHLHLKSQLLGRHQVGSLALVAALADQLGLNKEQIERGVAKTKPFEHRMEPYSLHGAWIIDDTYNGNIEGLQAGLALLKELPARRKLYITPGLVDQGPETKRVHTQLGELIAATNPEQTYLMANSVTGYIQNGLQKGHYKGEVVVEKDPLEFYTHLDQVVAAGDLVLMQNDWTDNYN